MSGCKYDRNAIKNHGDPRCNLDGISFIERFLVAEAPPELDDVEAAIDASPTHWWERWARVGIILFLVGFWTLMAFALLSCTRAAA